MLFRCALALRVLSVWRSAPGREPAFSTSCAACSKNRRLRQKRVISEKKLVSACVAHRAAPLLALPSARPSLSVTARYSLSFVLETPRRSFSSCQDGISSLLVPIRFSLKRVPRVAVWWCQICSNRSCRSAAPNGALVVHEFRLCARLPSDLTLILSHYYGGSLI